MVRFQLVFMKPPDTLSAVPDDPFADPLSWLVEDESIPRVGLPAKTSAEAWDMADQHLSVDPAVKTSFAFCVIDFERDVMVNLSLIKENWIGRVDRESLIRLFGDEAAGESLH